MGGGDAIGEAAGLDQEVLAQLRRVGGDDLVGELMRLYLTHTPERMRRARRALASGDLTGAAKAVHSLRSSSATLGASELARGLARVETCADRGDAEAVRRHWPEVENQVAALIERLEDQLIDA